MAKLKALTIDGQRFDLTAKADLVNGKVPAEQLPSYVDDVLEFANLAAFPETGEAGKIYLAIDTGKIYRWGGSVFVQVPTGSTYRVASGDLNVHPNVLNVQSGTWTATIDEIGNLYLKVQGTWISSKVNSAGSPQFVTWLTLPTSAPFSFTSFFPTGLNKYCSEPLVAYFSSATSANSRLYNSGSITFGAGYFILDSNGNVRGQEVQSSNATGDSFIGTFIFSLASQ